jgi:RHS repeat-associated protein
LADGSGNVTLAQGYTPFGVPLWSEGSGETGYGFTGERWEAYSALLFLRARYYEPGTGRFISRDPWTGAPQYPQTLQKWSYVENNPATQVDLSGRFSDEAIEKSLDGYTIGELFGLLSAWDDVGRWGLLALLRDAKDGTQLLARYVDFGYEGNDYPLAPDPDGAWCVKCDSTTQKIVFSRSKGSDLSFFEFLREFGSREDRIAAISDKWWRPNTSRFHWYESGGRFYSDWKGITQLPDLLMVSGSAELGIGVQAGFITDRYGNQYTSLGVGVGLGVDLGSAWEGYASRPGAFRMTRSGHPVYYQILAENELRDIIEGPGVSLTVVGPGVGLSAETWRNGSILLFGGRNYGLDTNVSFGWTWCRGNRLKESWDWVDRDIQGYDASILGKPNPGDGQGCDCE